MNSPQTENGYTRIANELVDVLCRTGLTAYQTRILWAVFRKTYGFGKKEDAISLSQFERMTGMKRAHVCRTINSLVGANIITRTEGSITTYSFNKLYDTWVVPNQGAPSAGTSLTRESPTRQSGSPQPGNGVVPNQGHTKETITKEILQKKPSSTRKGPNPGVQAIMDTMHECFGELDDSEAKNRQYAWNLLRKARKNMPGSTDEAIQNACVQLVRAAAAHDFWGHKITRVEHLYKNAKRITQDLRERTSKIAIIS